MKTITTLLIILHFFVGLGAMAGGYWGISDPMLSSMPDMNAEELLINAPFDNFFIPGLFLFAVIGLMNIAAGITAIKKWEFQGYYSGLMGGILMAWIVIQCFMIQAVNFLHVTFFIIGAVQAFLSLLLIVKKDQFPSRIIKKFLPVL